MARLYIRSILVSVSMLTVVTIYEMPLAYADEYETSDYIGGYVGTLGTQIVFSSDLPNSVLRPLIVPTGGADVSIFLRDCCIRDDIVEVYVSNNCRVARVDSRSGPFGTHPGETHVVSLGEGTYTLEYRNIFSLVGPSGWIVNETLTPFAGAPQCGIARLQIVCRPLDSPREDLGQWTSKVGRHCYFLATQFDGAAFTFGAYNKNTLRTPAKDADPVEPRGGCGAGTFESICVEVPPPPGTNLTAITTAIEQAVGRGPDAPYDKVSNNSNLWVRERITELGLNVSLPSSAITNEMELCAQLPQIRATLRQCKVPNWLIDKIQQEQVGTIDCST